MFKTFFFQCKHCIMTIPLPLQNKITYEPALPSIRNQLIQKVSMGSVIKTFVYYKTPFWRIEGAFCVHYASTVPFGFGLTVAFNSTSN